MARSWSGTREAGKQQQSQQQGLQGKVVSPPRMAQRRVTRSQSREPEGGGRKDKGKGKWGRDLPAIDESPRPPPQSPQKQPYNHHNHHPESPEDVTNISGTTMLPSEPDTGDLDPEVMLDALPDLSRAAKSILDFLVTGSTDLVRVVMAAKKLADPKNTQSKRLARSRSKLASEVREFGTKSYIDVGSVSEIMVNGLGSSMGEGWSPEGFLYRANCATFALEVLLAAGNGEAAKLVVRKVEGLFPGLFMGVGAEEALERVTVELAVEIRTQSVILAMEERQHELGFDARGMLREAFMVGVESEEDEGSEALRGFNGEVFGGSGGLLPARFRDVVYRRFAHLKMELGDEDEYVDVHVLKAAFRWHNLALCAADWVRRRTEEIDGVLKKQRSVQEVQEEHLLRSTSERIGSAGTPQRGTPSKTLGSQTTTPVTTPKKPVAQDAEKAAILGKTGPEITSPAAAVQKSPAQASTSTITTQPARDPQRRKSRPSFLNVPSLERIMQRQRRAREDPQTRPQINEKSDRQTIPQSRPDREVPASPEETTLLPDEADFLPADDSGFVETSRVEIEKSHSPPIARRQPATPPPIPSSQEMWNAVKPVEGPVNRASTDRQSREIENSHSPQIARPQPATPPGISSAQEMWNASKPAAEGRVNRAFTDRQTNAHRVSPISQPASEQRQQSRKRARSPSTSEDEFDSYAAQVDVPKRRREKPVQPKRARVVQDSEDEDEEPGVQLQTGLDETTRTGTARAESTRAGSTRAESTRPEPSRAGSTRPEQPRETTRPTPRPEPHEERHIRGSSIGQTYRPQVRWHPDEDARLIRLIGDYGCGWVQIIRQNQAQSEKEGETRIEGRDQVQLKDRARNLKVKFMREEAPLPRNFDKVSIKETDCKALARRGIFVPRDDWPKGKAPQQD